MAGKSFNGNVATSLGYSQYPYITGNYSLNGNPYKNNNYSLSPFWNYGNTEEDETNPYNNYQKWLEQNPGKTLIDYWNEAYQPATNTPDAVLPVSVKDDLDDDLDSANSGFKSSLTSLFGPNFGKEPGLVGFGLLKEARSNFKDALSATRTDDMTRHQAKKELKGTDEWRALRNSRMTTAGVGLGAIGDVANSILGDNEMYQGPKGDLTKGLDSAYDNIANGIAAAGPWGAMLSGVMKAGSAVNSGLLALGVGTDAMTNTDAILGSDFLALTPVGLINSIGAKKTDSFTLDVNAFKNVGSSYMGTWGLTRDASDKSEKKYGLFSRGAYRRALDTINNAKQQQAAVQNISKEATTRKAVSSSMNAINASKQRLQRAGGIKQRYSRIGKLGMKLANKIDSQFDIPKFKEGGIPNIWKKEEKNDFYSLVEENKKKNKKEEQNDIFIPEDAIPVWDFDDIIDIFDGDDEEEEEENQIPEYKEGGSIIPDGALHARKNNIETDVEITEKGIPVVAEKPDGELEQVAEIEREELIIRKEIIDQIEEMLKKFNSDETDLSERDNIAIEVGKLIVNELIHETEDKTGELL